MKKLQMFKSSGLAATTLLVYSGLAQATVGGPPSIPEPGPMGLLVLGGVALFIARRIHRNR